MARVIVTLLMLCQSFCLRSADVGFAEPGVGGSLGTATSRVVVVRDEAATRALAAEPEVVTRMVARGVMALTGKGTAAEAWRSLVSPADVIGIKVHSALGALSGTRPAVAAAVIKGLLDAGHPPSRIVVWDRRLSDLRGAGFADLAGSLGVRFAGAIESGFDPDVAYESQVLGQPVFGDLEFGRAITNLVVGRNSYFTRLVTKELTRHIHIAPLLNHSTAGVSGILYTVASACTDNFLRFELNPAVLARAVPEIYGHTNIADRAALNIVDALIGQYEGTQHGRLHYSAPLNELRFSTDPVALDALSLDELNRIRTTVGVAAVTNRSDLVTNARWLELGTDDLRRIDVLRIE